MFSFSQESTLQLSHVRSNHLNSRTKLWPLSVALCKAHVTRPSLTPPRYPPSPSRPSLFPYPLSFPLSLSDSSPFPLPTSVCYFNTPNIPSTLYISASHSFCSLFYPPVWSYVLFSLYFPVLFCRFVYPFFIYLFLFCFVLSAYLFGNDLVTCLLIVFICPVCLILFLFQFFPCSIPFFSVIPTFVS